MRFYELKKEVIKMNKQDCIDFLRSRDFNDDTINEIILSIQLDLLDDIIRFNEDVIRDIAADLPRYDSKDFKMEHGKLLGYIEVNRDLIESWDDKYDKMKGFPNK